MKRTVIIDCLENIGKDVVLEGWVVTVRSHGKIAFFDLRDRTCTLQIGGFGQDLAKQIASLNQQDVVRAIGLVKKRDERYVNKNNETGTIELELKSLETVAKAAEMPFDMAGKELSLQLPTLLDFRPLTLRHPEIAAIFSIQETIVKTYRKTLKDLGFTEIFVPTIVPAATEGGAEVFHINYYNHDAYLAQSPQMYKQMMVGVFERVFTVAHAYRAEPSVTTRHLSEYVSLDAEMGFITSYTDLMDVAEKVVGSIIRIIEQEHRDVLEKFAVTTPDISKPFPRLKMREAQEIILKRTGRDHRSEPDLDPQDEKEICAWALEEHGVPFVFITHYPTKKRPFYTMPDPKDPDFTLSFDLIGISEEWVTGGQRINDYDMLLDHVKKWGNKPENFELYLQAFQYGMPPEGGFAMGLERITKDILGLENIREASLFPRDMERVDEKLTKVQKDTKKS